LFEEIISSIDDFTPALILGFGLMVGIQHAFEPDHIAAVGTQLFKRKSKKNGKKTF
jgi:high-affinity nickel permease